MLNVTIAESPILFGWTYIICFVCQVAPLILQRIRQPHPFPLLTEENPSPGPLVVDTTLPTICDSEKSQLPNIFHQ
jgi:hypothetical protein